MQTGTIQFIQTSPEEMENRFFNRIKSEFESIKKEFQPKQPTEFLTRQQVKELLDVDLSTVHNWTKRGKLQAYGIAGRVYYKRAEVEQALKPINF
ncbi:MAG: excisionase family DNA binding domain-containing [Prolixibacteraceae bacterium]|nr:MAG: excisionase family DNA binding domain-containing [Prolixibacteraceae bacterium]